MALEGTTKVGANGLDDDVSTGGGGLTSSDSLSKLLFIHYGGFTADTTISSPQKFVEIFSHPDATIDIDNGVTVSVDSQCILLETDKTDFDVNFFANPSAGTNLQRESTFDDNVRTSTTINLSLSGKAKVGYSQIPTYLQTDLPFDIENNITITVDDGAVLVI